MVRVVLVLIVGVDDGSEPCRGRRLHSEVVEEITIAGAERAALADTAVVDDRVDGRVAERRQWRRGGEALGHDDLPGDARTRDLGVARVADGLVVDEIDLAAFERLIEAP